MSARAQKPPFNEVRLYQRMEEHDWDALVLLSMGNVAYLSAAPTVRYFQQHRPNGPRLAIVVLARNDHPTFIVGEMERPTSNESVWIEDQQFYRDYIVSPIDKLIEVLKKRGFGDKRIGLDSGVMGAPRYAQLISACPKATFEDCGPMMWDVRLEKTPEEIRRMKVAVDLMDEAFKEAFASITVGNSEVDLHEALFTGMYNRGLNELSGNSLAGEQAMVLHRKMSHDKKLEPGDIIRTDYIANYMGYFGNVSRVAVMVEPSQFQLDTYRHLVTVERELAGFARPGVGGSEMHAKAVELFGQRGLTLGLPLLGHSVGVEIHEDPMFVSSQPMALVNNAVFCMEPYVLNQFHIQDQYLVTPEGAQLLSDGFNTDEIHIIR